MLLRRRNRSLQYGTIELQSGNGLPRTLKTEESSLPVSNEGFHELQRGDDLQWSKRQVEKSRVHSCPNSTGAVCPFAGSPRGSQWTTKNRVIINILYIKYYVKIIIQSIYNSSVEWTDLLDKFLLKFFYSYILIIVKIHIQIPCEHRRFFLYILLKILVTI